MLKMTLLLIIGLYAGLAVWGEPDARVAIEPDRAAVRAAVQVAAAGPNYARPVILDPGGPGAPPVTRAAATRTIVPATTDAVGPSEPAVSPLGEPVVISLLQAEVPAPASGTSPETTDLLRVSGNGVNMRSGPSTADAVVATLPEGALAEAVGTATGGWREIRLIATGQTGFMVARFLDPA